MIDPTLTASLTDDGVELSLTVENTSDDARKLAFRSGQRAEFIAERAADDEPIWRYSDGRMFTMAVEDVTLRPSDTETYAATWRDPPHGEYVVRAWLVAEDVTAEAKTTVSVA